MYKINNIKKAVQLFSFLFVGWMMISCDKEAPSQSIYTLSAYSDNNRLRAVIEIPAGTNKKIEFNPETKAFAVDKRNGAERVIDYLPYPGNYGFIPGTYSDPAKGGDGDALDVVVLSSSLPTATVIEIIPIAMLPLIDEGEQDYKIIAIPAESQYQTITAQNLTDLRQKYPQVEEILRQWFLHYDRGNSSQVAAMADAAIAKLEIKKHLK